MYYVNSVYTANADTAAVVERGAYKDQFSGDSLYTELLTPTPWTKADYFVDSSTFGIISNFLYLKKLLDRIIFSYFSYHASLEICTSCLAATGHCATSCY